MQQPIPQILRFAVLTHDWPVAHLDLFLEQNGVLRAWRLPPDGLDEFWEGEAPAEPIMPDVAHREVRPPKHQQTVSRPSCIATVNHDHRLHYLDYIGPVSGDRGTVGKWDTGELEWLSETQELIKVRLGGAKLCGVYSLTRLDDNSWRFTPFAPSTSPS